MITKLRFAVLLWYCARVNLLLLLSQFCFLAWSDLRAGSSRPSNTLTYRYSNRFHLHISLHRFMQTEHISPKGHAAFVQKFVKLPFLMDICGLYQHEGMRQEMLVHIVSSSFGAHRRLYTDLKIFVRDLGDLVSTVQTITRCRK